MDFEDIGNVEIVNIKKSDYVSYKISQKLGLNMPLRDVYNLLKMGTNIIITDVDGAKNRLVLIPVEPPKQDLFGDQWRELWREMRPLFQAALNFKG